MKLSSLVLAAVCLTVGGNGAHAQSRRGAFIDLVRIHACGYLVNALTGGGQWHGGLYENELIIRVVEANTVIYRNNKTLVCGRIQYPENMSEADRTVFNETFEAPAFHIAKALIATPKETRNEALARSIAQPLRAYDHSHAMPEITVELTSDALNDTVWKEVPESVLEVDAWLLAQREH